jgi:Raf kinase inhibitor-like YbhB/YbcL family protein
MGKPLLIKLVLIFIMTALVACQSKNKNEGNNSAAGQAGGFVLRSKAFASGDSIPVKYTCDGQDISPELSWSGAPAGTKTFTLICDDPDAPMGTWVHWVLFNIGPEANSFPEKFELPKTRESIDEKYGDIIDGINDFRQLGYGGPCPPKGPAHRYLFKLYALDTNLGLKTGADKSAVEKAMEEHILAKAELIGKYKR